MVKLLVLRCSMWLSQDFRCKRIQRVQSSMSTLSGSSKYRLYLLAALRWCLHLCIKQICFWKASGKVSNLCGFNQSRWKLCLLHKVFAISIEDPPLFSRLAAVRLGDGMTSIYIYCMVHAKRSHIFQVLHTHSDWYCNGCYQLRDRRSTLPIWNYPNLDNQKITPSIPVLGKSMTMKSWLVVYLPLWKILISQLGWWHSQLNGKS